jgi:hypothetical protein
MYIIVKPDGERMPVIAGVEADSLAQAIAKLKGGDPGVEVLADNMVVIAGEIHLLRPLFVCKTPQDVVEIFKVPEQVQV